MSSASSVTVVGRYALHEVIAKGGMASVHVGRLIGPVGFSRIVAIKRLHPMCSGDPDFTAMFLDEARLVARVRHPNIVPTLDVVATDSELLLVLEYVEGEALSRLSQLSAARKEKIPVSIALSIAIGVLSGLHAAHEAKNEKGSPLSIVHRDVSPQNVVVDVDGIARVVDFGIAKAMGRLHTTRDGAVKGKLSYMPPEQLKAEPVDRRADVYSLTVMLWELLVGERLFTRDDDGATVSAVLTNEVVAPSKAAAASGSSSESSSTRIISPALDAIVLRGLSRDRDTRFPTAAAMLEALDSVGLPIASPREVSAWVKRIAGDVLAARAALVESVEASPTSDSSESLAVRNMVRADVAESATATTPMVDAATMPTMATMATPPPSSNLNARRTRHASFRGGAIGVVATIALLGAAWGAQTLYARRVSSAANANANANANASANAVAPPPAAVSSPIVSSSENATPPMDPAATAAPSASAAPPTSTARAVRAPTRHLPPPPPPSPSPPSTSSSDPCDPPYTVDATGVRVVKRQCLKKP